MKLSCIHIQQFSVTELQELYLVFQVPIVRKYLSSLSAQAAVDIALGDRKENQSAESFLEERARVQGGLMAIETLLAMQPAESTT